MTVGPVRRDEASADFFDGTARGEFLLIHCVNGHVSQPAVEQCGVCGSTDVSRRPASGGAAVVSWSVTHERSRGDQPARRTVLAVAELDEGPWWWSQIADAAPEAITVGTRLIIDFQRHEDFENVPIFRLAVDG